MELVIKATGQLQESNLEEFSVSVKGRIDQIKTDLVTDQDFADAKKMVKICEATEKKVKQAQQDTVAQIGDVQAVIATLADLCEDVRQTRLKLSKQIKTETDTRKAEVRADGVKKIDAIFAGSPFNYDPTMDVQSICSGKKTLASMEKAISDFVERKAEEFDLKMQLYHGNFDIMGRYPASLAPDAEQLALRSSGEVTAEMERRRLAKTIEDKNAEEMAPVAETVPVVDELPSQQANTSPTVAMPDFGDCIETEYKANVSFVVKASSIGGIKAFADMACAVEGVELIECLMQN